MQLYGLLHDPEPEVRQASTYALASYAQSLTKREAELCLSRLLALSRTGSVEVRLNALHSLKVLVSLPIMTHRRAEVEAIFKGMQQDVSYQVRSATQSEPFAVEEPLLVGTAT